MAFNAGTDNHWCPSGWTQQEAEVTGATDAAVEVSLLERKAGRRVEGVELEAQVEGIRRILQNARGNVFITKRTNAVNKGDDNAFVRQFRGTRWFSNQRNKYVR